LDPTPKGLPLEIYAFTNDTRWKNYEDIQSDIFDHLLAVVREFDLEVFQDPTGYEVNIDVAEQLNEGQDGQGLCSNSDGQ
jgi:miniconductance mechanosensitive channel